VGKGENGTLPGRPQLQEFLNDVEGDFSRLSLCTELIGSSGIRGSYPIISTFFGNLTGKEKVIGISSL